MFRQTSELSSPFISSEPSSPESRGLIFQITAFFAAALSLVFQQVKVNNVACEKVKQANIDLHFIQKFENLDDHAALICLGNMESWLGEAPDYSNSDQTLII